MTVENGKNHKIRCQESFRTSSLFDGFVVVCFLFNSNPYISTVFVDFQIILALPSCRGVHVHV